MLDYVAGIFAIIVAGLLICTPLFVYLKVWVLYIRGADRIREHLKGLFPGATARVETDVKNPRVWLEGVGIGLPCDLEYRPQHPPSGISKYQAMELAPNELLISFKSDLKLPFRISKRPSGRLVRWASFRASKRDSAANLSYASFFPDRSLNLAYSVVSMNRTILTLFIEKQDAQNFITALLSKNFSAIDNRDGKFTLTYSFRSLKAAPTVPQLQELATHVQAFFKTEAWRLLLENDAETEERGPLLFCGPNAFGGAVTKARYETSSASSKE